MQRFLLLFFILYLLAGCKSTTPASSSATTEMKSEQGLKVSGMLQEQGVTTYQYGTHILTSSGGKTLYALKSETIKLDTYIGKNVELQGIPVEGYPIEGGPEYLEVIKIKE